MDLDVYGLCLGGNVFGWTADRDASFAVLDAYVEAGGNFIDTADTYMRPNMGTSERIIGEWMAARGNRDAARDRHQGRLRRRALGGRTSPRTSTGRCSGCRPIASTSTTRTRTTASCRSRRPCARSTRSCATARSATSRRPTSAGERLPSRWSWPSAKGSRRYVWLQPHYNLVEREGYEREYAPIVAAHGLSVAPYYALASGFLTGKYRTAPRRQPARETARGISRRARARACSTRWTRSPPRTTRARRVAIAVARGQARLAAPIASARSPEQLSAVLPASDLRLSDDEIARLDEASS